MRRANYTTMWLLLKQKIFGEQLFDWVSIRQRDNWCIVYSCNKFSLHQQICQILKCHHQYHHSSAHHTSKQHLFRTGAVLRPINKRRIVQQHRDSGDIHSWMLQNRVKKIDERTNRAQVKCWIVVKQRQPQDSFPSITVWCGFCAVPAFFEHVPVQVFVNLWRETTESLNKHCKPPCTATVCVLGRGIPQTLQSELKESSGVSK